MIRELAEAFADGRQSDIFDDAGVEIEQIARRRIDAVEGIDVRDDARALRDGGRRSQQQAADEGNDEADAPLRPSP